MSRRSERVYALWSLFGVGLLDSFIDVSIYLWFCS